MPYCITCATYFKGRGSHCALHSSSFHTTRFSDRYNYSSDSTNPSSIHRTGHRRRRTPYLPVTYDAYDQNNGHGALVRYNHSTDSSISTALAQPLAHTFATLSHAHAISSLTYTVTPSGGQSLTAEANFEREQCPVCRKWYPDHQRLESHQWEFPVGCEMHATCMRVEDVQWHGTSERHERCFVRGCQSVYRKEGGWKGGVVEGHIRGWHCG